MHPEIDRREQEPPTFDRQAFARRLQEAREGRLMSQADLARASGSSQSTISEAENGRSAPRADLLFQIRAALGVSLDWLVAGEAGAPAPLEDAGELEAVRAAIATYIARTQARVAHTASISIKKG